MAIHTTLEFTSKTRTVDGQKVFSVYVEALYAVELDERVIAGKCNVMAARKGWKFLEGVTQAPVREVCGAFMTRRDYTVRLPKR